MVRLMDGIFEDLRREWDNGGHDRLAAIARDLGVDDWFRPHASQAPVATPVTVGTTAKEQHMGFVTDVKSELAAAAHDLAAHAVQFDQNVLPGLAAKLAALENNPVVDAVLAAAHVPPEALDIVVKTIEGLEVLYNPQQAAQAPVTAAQ